MPANGRWDLTWRLKGYSKSGIFRCFTGCVKHGIK